MRGAVRGAELHPLAGAQTWEHRVPADVSPLLAATLAVWALVTTDTAPQVFVF